MQDPRRGEVDAKLQVRLQLEARCRRQFTRLFLGPLAGGPFSLLMFDFGDPEDFSNVAFATNMEVEDLVRAWEELIASWRAWLWFMTRRTCRPCAQPLGLGPCDECETVGARAIGARGVLRLGPIWEFLDLAARASALLGLRCDVCGQRPAEPCNSTLGAFSCAYCADCLRVGREPWGAIVGALMGGLTRADVVGGLRQTVDATCALYGKTEDDLWADVERSHDEFNRAMEREAVERVQTDDCPAIGVLGMHSEEWYAGEACTWCREVPSK